MDPARPLLAAAARVRLLGAVAPVDADAERARLIAEATAGRDAVPRWSYPREDLDPLARDLELLAAELETDAQDRDAPLSLLYSARARELGLEARLVSRVGTAAFAGLARRRFGLAPGASADAATTALAWAALAPGPAEGALSESDGPSPDSLESCMRAAIGEARVPFTVEVRDDLFALAATGERTVFIARGRKLTAEDVRRTVAHELHAHVLPRTRAATREPKIFQLGTARGADDQEGYALVIEERQDLLSARRKRDLAIRHLATVHMDAGASFVECVRALARDHELGMPQAVGVAERIYRGGSGGQAGLGRERVYIASFMNVGAHLTAHPEDEDLLTSGQVAVDALPLLRAAGLG